MDGGWDRTSPCVPAFTVGAILPIDELKMRRLLHLLACRWSYHWYTYRTGRGINRMVGGEALWPSGGNRGLMRQCGPKEPPATFGRLLLGAIALLLVACGGSTPGGVIDASSEIPDLLGSSRTFAQAHLESLGYVVEIVEAQEKDSALGTVISTNPPAGTVASVGSVVVVRIAAAQPTTISPADTTTTTAEGLPLPVMEYFDELARSTEAGALRAAAMSDGRASSYAGYLAASRDPAATGDGIITQNGDSLSLCYPTETGKSCIDYGDFTINSHGRLSDFTVNGVALRAVQWKESALKNQAICVHYDEDMCDFDNPENDTSLYLVPSYVYRSASGALFMVTDVITGQRDLDILWDGSAERLNVTATKPNGDIEYPESWWTNPEMAVGSNIGLRIPRNTRTYLVLGFPGFAELDGSVKIELQLDWGGRQTWNVYLPALPSQ